MDRKTVIAGLKAYKRIEDDIRHKELFASEVEDGAQYLKEAEKLRKVKREMIRCMNDLPQLERDCVWSHYIKGDMWVRISQKYAYSERQIRNISNRGIDHLGKSLSRRPDVVRFCRAAKEQDTI